MRPSYRHAVIAAVATVVLTGGGLTAVAFSNGSDDPAATCATPVASPTPGGVGLTVTCTVPTPAPVTETATVTQTATETATATVTETATATVTATATATQTVTATPSPTPTPLTTAYGANYTQPDDETLYQGRPAVARIYIPAGALTADIANRSQYQRAYAAGIRTFVVSWKDNNPTLAGQMLDSFPDGTTVYGVFRHEPENDGSSAATWVAQQVTMMAAVRQHGGIPTAILMSYTLNPSSGRNLADWVLPAGTVDVLGFDYYPSQQTNRTQPQVVDAMKAAMPQFGVDRLLIGEYGVPVTNPTQGVTWINEFKQLVAGTAVVACYWSDTGTKDYHFTTATANAWFGS